MKSRKIILLLSLVLLLGIFLSLTACGYEAGDSVADGKDVEYTVDEEGTITQIKYNGKLYTVDYLVDDESNSIIHLQGQKLDQMRITGYQGAVRKLSLRKLKTPPL